MTRTLLFCALIVCSLASTAKNEKETIDTKNMKEKFNSKQVDSTENFEGGTFAPSIEEEKYDTTTIPNTSGTDTADLPPGPPGTDTADLPPGTSGTDATDSPPGPPGTDTADLPHDDEPSTEHNNSPKPENDYNSSDKKNSSTTERIPENDDDTQSKPNEPPTSPLPQIPTSIENGKNGSATTTADLPYGADEPVTEHNNSSKPENDYNSSDKKSTTGRIPTNDDDTQSKPNEPPTSTQPSSTTVIAILVNGSATTPGTPSAVTDLDVIKSSTSRPKSKNGYSTREKYSPSEPTTTTTTESARPKVRVRVTTPVPGWMWSSTTEDDIITSVLRSQSERFKEPARPKPAEWIKPTLTHCKCANGKGNCSKENTAGGHGQTRESRRWEEIRRRNNNNRETTTDRSKSEKDRSKLERQRKILEMESERFYSILNLL